MAHIFGDDELKGSVHTALNHSAETNAASYQNTIRQHKVVTAKGKIAELMGTHGEALKSILQVGSRCEYHFLFLINVLLCMVMLTVMLSMFLVLFRPISSEDRHYD